MSDPRTSRFPRTGSTSRPERASHARSATRNRRSARHVRVLRSALVAAVALGTAALGACDDAGTVSPEPDGSRDAMMHAGGPAATNAGLATLRQATARYHDVDAAVEDGFVQLLPCLEDPGGQGALGIPYGKLDRFDTNIDLSEPEVLFYEPQADGSLRLVGAEPVVPIAMWDAEHDEPPSMFGREFHRNEDHGLYGLHMWVWRPTADGVFGFWNPRVSCEFAE